LHWLLAVSVVANHYFLEGHDKIHHWLGYACVAFVVLRLLWSFWGAYHVKVNSFPWQPKLLLDFLRSYFRKDAKVYPGHNPAASYTYLLMWVCIFALGFTGWLLGLDAFWGDEQIETIHDWIAVGLQVLVLVHLIGVIADSIKFKRHTWLGMIRGHKG
jgi:cytochrome b